MAFNVHKRLHYADNERVVEALQLPTQIVIPNNAINETLGLHDLLQTYSKALSVPMAEWRGLFVSLLLLLSSFSKEEKDSRCIKPYTICILRGLVKLNCDQIIMNFFWPFFGILLNS